MEMPTPEKYKEMTAKMEQMKSMLDEMIGVMGEYIEEEPKDTPDDNKASFSKYLEKTERP